MHFNVKFTITVPESELVVLDGQTDEWIERVVPSALRSAGIPWNEVSDLTVEVVR